MKHFFQKILCKCLTLFYNKEIFSDKYFKNSSIGFLWCVRSIFHYSKLRRKHIRFPIGKQTRVSNGLNITFDASSLNIFQQPGCYFQCNENHIFIGSDVHVASNVGFITQNHNPVNPDEHLPGKDIFIGNCCWIGMNSVILPGVSLGDYTTVGAGSVVTHSFSGNCVIAGNPAKIIRNL